MRHERVAIARNNYRFMLVDDVEDVNKWEFSKGRSKLGICLLVIFICILLGVILWAVLLRTKKGETLCTTEKCITVAGAILDTVDHSIDPCDNFYDFVCRKWSKDNPIPDDSGDWGLLNKIRKKNLLILKKLFERPMGEMKSDSEKKVKRFYDSCKNSTNFLKQPVPESVDKLLGESGGWSFDPGFDIGNWSLEDTLHKLIDKNPAAIVFFARFILPDFKDRSRKLIHIGVGGLTLPVENYLHQTDELITIEHLMKQFGNWSSGSSGGDDLIQSSMKEVLKLETELANITMQAPIRQNRSEWKEITLEQLQTQAPFINWKSYFKRLMGLVKQGISVSNDTIVKITAPGYLNKISALVEEYQSPSQKKILNDYMIWQSFQRLQTKVSKPGQLKSDFCVKETEKQLSFASGAMFVKETFDEEMKPLMEEMIREIKHGFSEELKGLDWIDQETKQGVEKKLNAMQQYIGYPEFIMNSTKLDEYYQDLEIKENDYYANYLAVAEKGVKDNLRQEVDTVMWQFSLASANAFYYNPNNVMILIAGIMQRPYLEVGRPKSINYGAYGTIIGHEITHAFDNRGCQYDSHGNTRVWWTETMMKKFNDKVECLTKEYEKFEVDGHHVNGSSTLGENIADHGGLRAAYRAYLDSPKTDVDLNPLPGLDFTHRQLFFISFAQNWCSSTTTSYLHHQIKKDEHSPNKFRVLGALAHFDEFSKEFKCKPNSRMNPTQKCGVW